MLLRDTGPPSAFLQAFPTMAKDIGTAFQNRPDLRSPICLALTRLCCQTRKLAADAGILEAAGILGSGPVQSAAGAEEEPVPEQVDIMALTTAPAAARRCTAPTVPPWLQPLGFRASSCFPMLRAGCPEYPR